jgi:ribonuclease P protein component
MVIDPTARQPHVGYAIGRRSGGAVDRNLMRRRLRACLAQHGDALPAGWFLVGVSPRDAQPTWSEVQASVARLVAAVLDKAARP